MKFLTTGSASGLGRYIFEHLGGLALTRATTQEEFSAMRQRGVDCIIHCAFNSAREIDRSNLYSYIEDNLWLVKELAKIPHKRFVFLSSVDVYLKNDHLHHEEEKISLNALQGAYAMTKLMAEAMVQCDCRDPLILRASTLLGHYARKNSLIQMLEEKNCCVTLSTDSELNFVRHADVLAFIRYALENDISGIYNVTSTGNISFAALAEMIGRRVSFGSYRYCVGKIDNRKIVKIFPIFGQNSRNVVEQFIQEW